MLSHMEMLLWQTNGTDNTLEPVGRLWLAIFPVEEEMVRMKTTEYKVPNVTSVLYSPGGISTCRIETPHHFRIVALGAWRGCIGVMPVALGAWGAVHTFLPNTLPQRGPER